MSTTAKLVHPWDYNHDVVGFNYRMPNLNATLLLTQLKSFDEILFKKRELYNKYVQAFKDLNLSLIAEAPECLSNYWLICLDLQADNMSLRNNILKFLNENKVMTRPLWTPLYSLEPYKYYSRGSVKNCDNAFLNILNIPSSPHLIN